MPKTCCAVGCSHHSISRTKYSFHTFPKDPIRWLMWVHAVRRINADGSKWRPTKEMVLCNEHFLTGKPSVDPNNPDYVPSVFKHQQSSPTDAETNTKRKRKIPVPASPPSKKKFGFKPPFIQVNMTSEVPCRQSSEHKCFGNNYYSKNGVTYIPDEQLIKHWQVF